MNALRTVLTCLLIALLCSLAPGCRKKDKHDADEPQPLAPVSASFKALYYYGGPPPLEMDSVCSPARIVFAINDPTIDTVQWQIGLEGQKRAGKSVQVYFDQPEGPVEITCYARRKPELCPPGTACSDTLTKTFWVMKGRRNDYMGDFNFVGTFEGQSTQYPGETYQVKITQRPDGTSMYTEMFIGNLLKDCIFPMYEQDEVQLFAPNKFFINPLWHEPKHCRMGRFDRDGKVLEYEGIRNIGHFNPHSDSIMIDYHAEAIDTVQTDQGPKEHRYSEMYTFRGKRI